MFTFLFRKKAPEPISPGLDEKLSRKILSFLGSEDIAETLPAIHPNLKAELTSTYADIMAIASERVLIFKKTLSPSALFANPDSFDYIKLSGGYSNTTYRLSQSGAKAYISRIAGVGTDSFIDRRAEWHNASIAAELELNPTIVFNDQSGNQLSHCLPSPQALTPELLHEHPEYFTKIAEQLRTLHHSPKKFLNDASIFKRNAAFFTRIKDSELHLPEEYAPIRARTIELEHLFARLDVPFVPCHNDTYYNNFLLSDGKLWLIDWEYSGNHDPMWDLAYFSSLAHLTETQKALLLNQYFACPDFKESHSLDYLRFVAYSLIVKDFLILWTYVQLANGNLVAPEAELVKWADDALVEGKLILADEGFNNAVLRLEEVSRERPAIRT